MSKLNLILRTFSVTGSVAGLFLTKWSFVNKGSRVNRINSTDFTVGFGIQDGRLQNFM